jgi:site-specific DNA-cytosine methylase
VSRDIEPSEPKRKETSSDASRSIGADDRLGADQYNAVILGDTVSTLGVNCGMSHGRQCVLEPQEVVCFEPGIASREGGHIHENICGTPRANAGDNQMATAYGISSYNSNAMKSSNPHSGIYEADTSRTLDLNGGNPSCHQGGIAIVESVPYTLNAFDVGDVRTTEAVVYALDRALFNQGKNAQFDFEVSDKGVTSPPVAKGPSDVCYKKTYQQTTGPLMANSHPGAYSGQDAYQDMFVVGETTDCYAVDCRNATESSVNGALQSNSAHSLNGNNVVRTRYIVRRLTPLECERLQGYPDGWTDIGEYTDSNGKKRQTSDAARYKALGNSISLPNWRWVLKRICACYERDATMASLFDGIGGFPYLWEQLNGKGTCLWASEIEEFPMAVTKVRIGE